MVLLVALMVLVLAASARAAQKDKLAMANSDRPRWTELDIIDLREGFRDNLSIFDLADRLLRTEADVANKARELGIKLRIA